MTIMSFLNRVKKEATDYINLQESEEATYKGAGNVLDFVENDLITKFVYFYDINSKEALDSLINDALANKDEVYYGMASCHQLCDPRLVQISDSTVLAKITRLFEEESV